MSNHDEYIKLSVGNIHIDEIVTVHKRNYTRKDPFYVVLRNGYCCATYNKNIESEIKKAREKSKALPHEATH
jgi:hypothetical protein